MDKSINGSFGKVFLLTNNGFMTQLSMLRKKDVLIVHAAGNDAKDIDFAENFPNDSEDKKTEYVDNMITIGA
jgi:hypothetical protein